MSVQNKVLDILLHHTDTPISGQVLADHLNVSRNAVWKAVEQLRQQGYQIDSQRNAGYQLKQVSKQIDANQITAQLDSIWEDLHVEVFQEVTSTNNLAKEFAIKNPGKNALFVSEKQSAGRGRHGRSFLSTIGEGLYFSLVIQPSTTNTQYIPRYTIAAATAVAKAVEELIHQPLQIKWVNDLFYKGLKVGGILSEATTNLESGTISAVVIGIGLNLAGNFHDAPDDVAQVAGTLFSGKLPADFNRNRLLNLFLTYFAPYHTNLMDSDFMPDYSQRLLGMNQQVEYQLNQQARQGTIIGLNPDGHLLVKEASGEVVELMGQDIHLSSQQFIHRK